MQGTAISDKFALINKQDDNGREAWVPNKHVAYQNNQFLCHLLTINKHDDAMDDRQPRKR